MQNLNKAITIFPPVLDWHALVLQDVMQLLLFSRDGCTTVSGEILPKTSFFQQRFTKIFPQVEGNMKTLWLSSWISWKTLALELLH